MDRSRAKEIAHERLARHRNQARAHPLAILVWGPAPQPDGPKDLRACVRSLLEESGHYVAYSEDLVEDDAVPDPLLDEVLQADAFDLIVVLYGGRGTQSERDTILQHDRLANKALIVIDHETRNRIRKSVTGYSWSVTKAYILEVSPDEEDGQTASRVCDWVDETRRCEYVRRLLHQEVAR